MTGGPILQTQVYSDSSGFDILAREWNELLHDSAADTVFLTHQWQSTWWRHLGDGTPTLIAVRADDGRLVGLARLYRTLTDAGEWELNTVGCVDVSDYLDLIARRGYEDAVYGALLDLLAAPPGEGLAWDVLRLCNVPAASPTLAGLKPLAAGRGLAVTDRVQEVCPIVMLDGDWEAYLESLDGKERRELRRKMRKANPHVGVDWTIVGPENDLPAEVDRFLHLMALSHPDKAEFLHAGHRAFMHDVARFAADEGWLELAFLTVDDEPAAAQFNLVYNNRTLLYNSGLDPTRFLHLSPGIVLTGFLIRHSIEAGREAFDFLRGDEGYKYQLGGVDSPIYQLVIRRG
jgi:CelD/BcsL family acetyltransferase involved in cellulose biosynthesis